MNIKPIETHYAGCRFRSRLEARYAVFFDHIGARWEYEPQGFVIDGRPYLPDFLLTDCGTWVEVKGSEEDLDRDLMAAAPLFLPPAASAPTLLLLGPMPRPLHRGDWGWLGLSAWTDVDEGEGIADGWYGFGEYSSAKSLVRVDTSSGTPFFGGDDEEWLTPASGGGIERGVTDAYQVARSARFEHGERP